MMSPATPTHSLQMNTVGPATSLRTSDCALLQNEQRITGEVGIDEPPVIRLSAMADVNKIPGERSDARRGVISRHAAAGRLHDFRASAIRATNAHVPSSTTNGMKRIRYDE